MLNPSPDAGIHSLFRENSPAQAKNEEFLNNLDENIQKIIKEQVKEQVKVQVSNILAKIVNEQLEAEVLTRSSKSSKTSYDVVVDLSQMELKKIIIEKMESNKSIPRSDEQKNLYKALSQSQQALQRRRRPRPLASLPKGPNLIKGLQASAADDQPIVIASQHLEWFQQQNKPPTLDRDWNKTLPATHESIQPWISDLAKQADSRSSFIELMDTPMDFSVFLMNRLKVDTLTPELLASLTYELIKGSCKSLVELKFFLEEVYKATTDKLDCQEPVGYDKYALWGISHWGANVNSSTDLQSTGMRRDDDKLYKLKEGDFKRLRIQDNKDMLLLLIQGKLTDRTVEECFAFNVSLRMFTRSIVIQRRVEDLQLGIESYQKKLNLTKSDTYRFDLKRKEAYTAYSNPRGFIYQNKDNQNRLLQINELHKFSDETLDDVPTALDEHLKCIRMNYLPQPIWRKSDKERAATMI
nr:hypothetical protein [Tanacetum cinerariifolium]